MEVTTSTYAQPNAELAWELARRWRMDSEWKRLARFNVRIKKDIKLSALLRTTYAIKRQFVRGHVRPTVPSMRPRAAARRRRMRRRRKEEEEEKEKQEEESEKAAAILRVQHSR